MTPTAGLLAEVRENLDELEQRVNALHAADSDDDAAGRHQSYADMFRFTHNVKGVSVLMELPQLTEVAHAAEQVLAELRESRLAANPKLIDLLYVSVDAMKKLVAGDDVDEVNSLSAVLHKAARGEDFDVVLPTQTPTSPPQAKPTDDAKDASKKAKTVRRQRGNDDESVRVKTALLDALMEKIGELVIERNQLAQRLPDTVREVPQVEPTLNQVSGLITSMQELVVSTRLMPVGNLFRRFPRLVRDLSRKVGKQVELVLDDGDAELDRTLIEALADPLTHLIRNSLDHGLEPADEREAQGKGPTGRITLRATSEGGMVNLDVVDDGRGLNPSIIGRIAVERGVITSDQLVTATDQQVIELIFAPGFSTASEVTDLSGRGVGMDVVRTNIEALGGAVEVQSTVGRGTTFSLKLPLTMAIVTTLLVRVAGQAFAVPESAIEEVIRLRRHDEGGPQPSPNTGLASDDDDELIDTLLERDVLRLRGMLIPLARLDEELDLRQRRKRAANDDVFADDDVAAPDAELDDDDDVDDVDDAPPSDVFDDEVVELPPPVDDAGRVVLVLKSGKDRFALLVDDIVNPLELVIKPIPEVVGHHRLFSGASILGDGRITLVLDPIGLSTLPCLLPLTGRDHDDDDDDEVFDNESVDVIVFNNGGREQFAIPLVMVERMERVRPHQLEEDNGLLMVRRPQGDVPVHFIDRFFDVDRNEGSATGFTLILPRAAHGTRGILAVGDADTCTLDGELERTALPDPKLLGTVMRDGGLLAVIDPHRLGYARSKPEVTSRNMRALVVDDSSAYREIASELLFDVGLDVVLAEDGVDALAALEQHHFDILVSDITMPRMNGLELIQRVRTMARLKHLPAVALTSLSSATDREQALQSGFDFYLQKLDRELIQDAVVNLLKIAHDEKQAS